MNNTPSDLELLRTRWVLTTGVPWPQSYQEAQLFFDLDVVDEIPSIDREYWSGRDKSNWQQALAQFEKELSAHWGSS